MLAVSLEKLSKQLQRELKRNPKQASILALLGLVAVWFWLPLILPKDDAVSSPVVTPPPNTSAATTSTASVVSSTSGTTTIGTATSPSSVTSAVKAQRWDEVLSEIDSDPMMQPITVLTAATLDRSPFAMYHDPKKIEAERQEAAEAEVAKVVVPVVEPVVTPEEAGLDVSGTIVSRTRGSATINGQAYRQGDLVEGKSGVEFKLVTVESSGVVLERKGKLFVVTIRRTPRSGRVEMRAND